MLIVVVGYLCLPCMLYNGTYLTVGIFVCRVFCIMAHTWHEVQGQPWICSHQTSIYSSFSSHLRHPSGRTVKWNPGRRTRASHQVSSRFSRICAIKMKRQICIFWYVLDLFTTFRLGTVVFWILDCKKSPVDLVRGVVFWIFSPLCVRQSCGLHLHHIGLRHYSLSHLIEVPRVRKHISK